MSTITPPARADYVVAPRTPVNRARDAHLLRRAVAGTHLLNSPRTRLTAG